MEMTPENFKKAIYTFFKNYQEAADFFQCSEARIRKFASSGGVPVFLQIALRAMYKEMVVREELKQVKEYAGMDPNMSFKQFKKVLEVIDDK